MLRIVASYFALPDKLRTACWLLVERTRLLLASGGAVGLVGMVLAGADHPFWQQLFLHRFLDLIAVGWFTLASLGVAWARLGSAGAGWLPTYVLALLLAPTFFLGMSPAVLTPGLLWLAILTNGDALVRCQHLEPQSNPIATRYSSRSAPARSA